MADQILSLRIIVENPVPGVSIQVQRGRAGLLAPLRSTANALSFDLDVRLGATAEKDALRFLGEYTQGPVATRFVYVNSGSCAGQLGSPWTRRAKVSLMSITPELVRSVLASQDLVLEARIAGRARDGGPMCASVPLLGDGWTLTVRGK